MLTRFIDEWWWAITIMVLAGGWWLVRRWQRYRSAKRLLQTPEKRLARSLGRILNPPGRDR